MPPTFKGTSREEEVNRNQLTVDSEQLQGALKRAGEQNRREESEPEPPVRPSPTER